MIKEKNIFKSKYKISKVVYDGFLNTFKDCNKLHTNLEVANRFGFTDKIMHGNILNGFLSNFIGEVLPIKNIIIYYQDINYRSPVYLNDYLILIAEASHISISTGSIEFKYNFKKEGSGIIANGKFRIGILD